MDIIIREIKDNFDKLDDSLKNRYINTIIHNSFLSLKFLHNCKINILTNKQYKKLKKAIIMDPATIFKFVKDGFFDILTEKEKNIMINNAINDQGSFYRNNNDNIIVILHNTKLTEKQRLRLFKNLVYKNTPASLETYLLFNRQFFTLNIKEVRFLINYIFENINIYPVTILGGIGIFLYNYYKNFIMSFPEDLIYKLEDFLIVYKMTLGSK